MDAVSLLSDGSHIRLAKSPAPGIYERVFDYDQYVPLDYWDEGALLTPSNQANRLRQFSAFRQLYDGEYWRWGNFAVRMNYHEIVANFMADLLMGFPPILDGIDELPPRFINTLLDALHCLIVDMVRYGTGLLHVMQGHYGPEVISRDPTNFFPASAGECAFISEGADVIDVYLFSDDGGALHEQYDSESGGKLGRLLSSDDLTVGTVDDWAYIGSEFTGRIGALVNVGRRPMIGDWGKSLYPSITNLAFENSRGMTDNSETLVEHLKPLLLWIAGDKAIGRGARNKPDKEQELKDKSRRDWLERLRQYPTAELPDGIIDAKYVSWRPDMTGSFIHNEEIEKKLFTATNISAELYGTGVEKRNVSGVALDRQYLRSAIYARGFQTGIIESVKKVAAIGGVHIGLTGSRLAAFVEGISIEWPLVFDRIEERDDVVIDSGGVETEEAADELLPTE